MASFMLCGTYQSEGMVRSLEDHGLFHDVCYQSEEVCPGRLDFLCPLVTHGWLDGADELRSYQLQIQEGKCKH